MSVYNGVGSGPLVLVILYMFVGQSPVGDAVSIDGSRKRITVNGSRINPSAVASVRAHTVGTVPYRGCKPR